MTLQEYSSLTEAERWAMRLSQGFAAVAATRRRIIDGAFAPESQDSSSSRSSEADARRLKA